MSDASRSTEILFEPLRIGGIEVRNRIVLGPMAALQPQKDGRPSGHSHAFLASRARGGVGLIITGGGVATQRAWDEGPTRFATIASRTSFGAIERTVVCAA